MNEIIEVLNRINSDNSRFLINIINANRASKKYIDSQVKNTEIIISKEKTDLKNGIINLDEINADKYFYTIMRVKINHIIKLLLSTDKEKLKSRKTLKSIIYSEPKVQLDKNDNKDLVDVIKELEVNNITSLKFVANCIDEITVFKEEQLNLALKIIGLNGKEKYEKIYEYVCNYLKNDFLKNNYCDFINDKCIAQRRPHLYPVTSKDGCCFMQIRKCTHLENKRCNTECLPCLLFSCPYLSKRGITYYATEIPLLQAFLNKKQRHILVFDFYKTKNELIDKLLNI